MILYLGPLSPLVEFIECNEPVLWTRERIDVQFVDRHRPDFIVSYNYPHILRRDVLETIRWRAINLHISYLNWKGAIDGRTYWAGDQLRRDWNLSLFGYSDCVVAGSKTQKKARTEK